MANTKNAKTTKKDENEEIKKVEEIKETQVTENEEIIALKKQLEEMQKAMMTMMANNMGTQKVVVQNEEEEVTIGCRILQGIGWGDPKDSAGEIRLRFNEEQVITVSDMKKFFRNFSVKKLFIDGICYFTKPEDYNIFGIKEHIDLSDEHLKNILTNGDTNIIVGKIAALTDNKKNANIVNCITYRICDMIRKNLLSWDYYTRKGIEQYLNVEFDKGIMTLTAMDNFIQR